MKRLINIRGASGSGKTTAVKQFCERRGFRVEQVQTPFATFPVSLIDAGKIIVLGDYSANGNCLGVDRYKNGKSDIMDCLMEVAIRYSPAIILYEHMLGSNTCAGTKEIAEVASAFGYSYYGIFLKLSDEKRLQNLYTRAGKNPGLKQFGNRAKRTERAAEMLNEAGLQCAIVNVEGIARDDMWRIVDDAVREKIE